jgi:tetratricopeptide (TPR) repeat protein
MQDDLQKAYSAYQQALYYLPNPKVCHVATCHTAAFSSSPVQEDPKLWYGIGILYDRYGSLDHAEEAFASVLKMDKGWHSFLFAEGLLCTHLAELDFDKANEILFRLGIIYKQQGKYEDSLTCFDRILRNPPSPLAYADIWFQIGHVYEQQKDASPSCPLPIRCGDIHHIYFSMSMRKTHMNVSLPTTLVMPRCFNKVGSIIRTAPLSRIKNLPSNISRRVLKLVCPRLYRYLDFC